MKTKQHRLRRGLIGFGLTLLVLLGAFYVYTLDYYRADESVWALFDETSVVVDGRYTIFYPADSNDNRQGLIFYPGGKVEPQAYAPLLKQLADQGLTVVLVEMPFHLAVFDIQAADDIEDLGLDVDHWFLSGHSLGGAMASSYADGHADQLSGLILMGAYPINDADVPTLVIYGTEDHGLDMDKVKLADLQVRLDGGNHAYFGDYGEQRGDGQATMSRPEQQRRTVAAIIQFIHTITQ